MNNENIKITASLVNEQERLNFYPKLFSVPLMMKGEQIVFRYMRNFSKSYDGGLWNFYQLSNGGGFMAPDFDDELYLECGYFEGHMSAEAAGITVTLYTLGWLMAEVYDKEYHEELLNYLTIRYDQLYDYTIEHTEKNQILKAID